MSTVGRFTAVKTAACAVALAGMVLLAGCGNPGNGGSGKDEGGDGGDNGGNPPGGYTGSYGSVSYGDKTYKTVKIGNQTWFAENLNYDVEGSVCYNNSVDSCAKYGRLYNWATAMGIDASYNNKYWDGGDVKHQDVCPVGWHLPNDAEWRQLTDYVGGSSTAGKKLKSTNGWYNGNGTNQYGFSALPGGGDFSPAGAHGRWWSATEIHASLARNLYMFYDGDIVLVGSDTKDSRFSVRCVQD